MLAKSRQSAFSKRAEGYNVPFGCSIYLRVQCREALELEHQELRRQLQLLGAQRSPTLVLGGPVRSVSVVKFGGLGCRSARRRARSQKLPLKFLVCFFAYVWLVGIRGDRTAAAKVVVGAAVQPQPRAGHGVPMPREFGGK